MLEPQHMGLDGELRRLDSTPHGNAHSVATLEAQVDNNPQLLRPIKPYVQSQVSIPTIISPEAQVVMHALFECFGRQQEVQEGLIGDLMWGFAQVGIPDTVTWQGLRDLRTLGYLKFQAPDNTFVDPESDHIGKSWVRYQAKLLELVYEQT